MQIGTRIRLIAMPDDPCPVEPGTCGTVDYVGGGVYGGTKQYGVQWDNGRTLSIVVPPDVVQVIPQEGADVL